LEQVAIPFIVFAEQMRVRYEALLKAEPQNLLREEERLNRRGKKARNPRTPHRRRNSHDCGATRQEAQVAFILTGSLSELDMGSAGH